MSARPGIDQLLAQARQHLDRLTVIRTFDQLDSIVLIDIRPYAQRVEFGEIGGSLVLERNVLEWRLDPTSEFRISAARNWDLPVVLICQGGYASSLAARGLQELGLSRATDVIGGIEAWDRAGLPLVEGGTSAGNYVTTRARFVRRQPSLQLARQRA